MSNEAINATLYKQVGSPTQKAVLMALANWADQDDKCWPSIKKLGLVTQLSERTVQRALADLEVAGHIEKQVRCNDKGLHTSSKFRLTYVPDPLADHLAGGATVAGSGASVAGGGATVTRGGGVTVTPNTYSSSHHPETTKTQGIPAGSVELPFDPPAWGSPEPEAAATKVTSDDLIETWNRICGEKVRKHTRITEARKQLVMRRFKEEFESDPVKWERFCKRVARSPFLTGQNDRNWRPPNIEWVLKPEKLTNILEGVYDDKSAQRLARNPNLLPGEPGWRPSPGTI